MGCGQSEFFSDFWIFLTWQDPLASVTNLIWRMDWAVCCVLCILISESTTSCFKLSLVGNIFRHAVMCTSKSTDSILKQAGWLSEPVSRLLHPDAPIGGFAGVNHSTCIDELRQHGTRVWFVKYNHEDLVLGVIIKWKVAILYDTRYFSAFRTTTLKGVLTAAHTDWGHKLYKKPKLFKNVLYDSIWGCISLRLFPP